MAHQTQEQNGGRSRGEILDEAGSNIPSAQTSIFEILKGYTVLEKDHERMKFELKTTLEACDRYMQIAKEYAKNAFVLVLIDADGYSFKDGFVKDGVKGGLRAAELLQQKITRWLADDGLHNCDVKVQAYANILSLSKIMRHAELCGPEERAFGHFAAGFTEFKGLFDFTDSGEEDSSTRRKVVSTFLHHIKHPSCSHIYFAGCHDAGYIRAIEPHTYPGARVTLIDTPNMHPKFRELDVATRKISGLFQGTQLKVARNASSRSNTDSGMPAVLEHVTNDPPVKESNAKFCAFFLKGRCKFGTECKNSHVKPSQLTTTSRILLMESKEKQADRSVRYTQQESKVSTSSPRQPTVKQTKNAPVVTIRGKQALPDGRECSKTDFATILPDQKRSQQGYVGINSKGYRIDPYLPIPTKQGSIEFDGRHRKKHFCNSFHLVGHCNKGDRCKFNHGHVSTGILNALRRKARSNPCRRKGACRILHCMAGHMCQFANCQYRGGDVQCKMGPEYHLDDRDLVTTHYVRGESQVGQDRDDRASVSSIADSVISTHPASQSPAANGSRQLSEETPNQGLVEEVPLIVFDDVTMPDPNSLSESPFSDNTALSAEALLNDFT